MRYQRSFIVAGWMALLAGGAGCASIRGRPTPPPGGTPSAEERAACPMLVPGAEVTVEDTAGGVALAFTTGTGDVEELRRTAHRWAGMHARAYSTMPRRAGSGARGMIGGHGMNIASTARIEDIPGGARVVLTPLDSADLGRLREAALRHEEPTEASEFCLGMMGSSPPTSSAAGPPSP